MMRRRCLVLGGNGFIGSHVVEALRRVGHAVVVMDVKPPRADLDWDGIEYHRGSLQDDSVLELALDQADVIFHLASTAVPSTSNDDPVADISQNLVGSIRLLQAMIARGKRRVVFFSSGGTVYGNPTVLPVPEDHALEPLCSYGVVKVAIERYLLMYHGLGQLDPLILRPGNPFGPRQSGAGIQGVIPAFLDRLHRGEALRLWGDGSATRDFLYISDLAEAAVTAGMGPVNGVFNVGSGEATTLNEIIALAERVTGHRARVEHLPERPFDVKHLTLDINCARKAFGWAPRVSIEEGMRLAWRAFLDARALPGAMEGV